MQLWFVTVVPKL